MRLDGIRVLDLTRLLPGPYATQLLADLGADVVKVEDTDRGDYARHMPPRTDSGAGAIFDGVNRGKRSIAVDLKDEGGREAFYALVEESDAVIEGFRPGVVERLGVDFETLREHRPDLVYCSLTGYGQTGPLADRAGHDLNYVGRAGLLDMSRDDETDAPSAPGYQVADLGGGLCAAFSVVSALLSRELGDGGGEYVDVSMADVVLSFSQTVAHGALAAAESDERGPRPGETPLTGAFPWYDVYETSDGKYVTLGALEPQFWRAFCGAVDREELVEYHDTDDAAEREALREELETLFAGQTREEWAAAFDADATVEPVLTPAEAVADEQFAARDVVQRGDRPRVGFPAVCDRPDADESIPGHGEHTDALLSAAGLSDGEIERLREDGAVR